MDKINKMIEKYKKETDKNHNELKKQYVDSYYNGVLGYNLDVDSLSKSELDNHFKQTLDRNPALNFYYQNTKYIYGP